MAALVDGLRLFERQRRKGEEHPIGHFHFTHGALGWELWWRFGTVNTKHTQIITSAWVCALFHPFG